MQSKMSEHENRSYILKIRDYFCTECCSFVQHTTLHKMLHHAVFTWSTPNWRKHDFQERLSQLNKKGYGSASTTQTSLTRTRSWPPNSPDMKPHSWCVEAQGWHSNIRLIINFFSAYHCSLAYTTFQHLFLSVANLREVRCTLSRWWANSNIDVAKY